MSKEVNQLTRESIETALAILLEKKNIDDISITELTEKAGVSRGAFYRNYRSKQAVLASYLQNLLMNIDSKGWQAVGGEDDFEDYWCAMFTEWKKNARLLKFLTKEDFTSLMLYRINRISDSYYGENERWARYREYLLYGAMSNVTTEWMRGGMKESPEEMAHFCSYMLGTLRGRYTGRADELPPKER